MAIRPPLAFVTTAPESVTPPRYPSIDTLSDCQHTRHSEKPSERPCARQQPQELTGRLRTLPDRAPRRHQMHRRRRRFPAHAEAFQLSALIGNRSNPFSGIQPPQDIDLTLAELTFAIIDKGPTRHGCDFAQLLLLLLVHPGSGDSGSQHLEQPPYYHEHKKVGAEQANQTLTDGGPQDRE
jgi:hypothetical protein